MMRLLLILYRKYTINEIRPKYFFDKLFSEDKNSNLSLRSDADCAVPNKVLKYKSAFR